MASMENIDGLRLAKGPAEVLRALASGDPDRLREALAFQRESFRATFGLYPEECKIMYLCDTCGEYHDTPEHPA
jgi:hypothetical protein